MASAAACIKDTPLYMSCMSRGGGEKSGVVSGREKNEVVKKAVEWCEMERSGGIVKEKRWKRKEVKKRKERE
jgi:hypothetical protein